MPLARLPRRLGRDHAEPRSHRGGQSLRHAIDMTLIIEQTADKLIACHTLGKTPPVLPDEIVTALRSLGQMIV